MENWNILQEDLGDPDNQVGIGMKELKSRVLLFGMK